MSFELHHGDCLEIMPRLVERFDLILADLPYGTTACEWDSVISLDELWCEYKRLIKPNGVIALFGVMPFSAILWQSNPSWWRYDFIWRKNGATRFLDANNRPLLDYEKISIFYAYQPTYNPQKWIGEKTHSRGKAAGKKSTTRLYGDWTLQEADRSGMKYPRLVLDFDKVPPSKIVHPTQKPVKLLQYIIRTFTNSGDTVLDNTMGSGSCGVACIRTSRNFVGIEKELEYFKIAEQRIRSAQPALFVEDGQPANNRLHNDRATPEGKQAQLFNINSGQDGSEHNPPGM